MHADGWPLPPGAPSQRALTAVEQWSWDGAGDPWEALQAWVCGPHESGVLGWGLLLSHAAAVAGLHHRDAYGGASLGTPRDTPALAVPQVAAIGYAAARASVTPTTGGIPRGGWRSSWTDQQHEEAVSAVRAAIATGDVYQANLVSHQQREIAGDMQARAAAWAVHGIGGAWRGSLAGQGWSVHSASPELMVRTRGRRVWTEPIKGTAMAGGSDLLMASAKDRAEHVMIVDLERNDLARIASIGSVEVESLYELQQWSGLTHAHSRVAAELSEGVGLAKLLRCLLPGGSVTGAPKSSALRLIHELEPVGRGPSMGAMGWLSLEGDLDLALTIRTIACDHDAGELHLWAGGGVTWSSSPRGEVAEARAKARPLIEALGGL